MNLRYLKTFVAVAEQGNFARAANAVGLTQSAVSMQMRALENLLGTELFDRTKRPAVLNEHGEAQVRRAREIVELYGLLVKAVVCPDDLPGVVHLGAVRSTLISLMPRALAALNQRFPGVSISAVGALPGDLIARVESGELDAALVSEPRYLPPQLTFTPIMEEPLVLIAPADAQGDAADEVLTSHPYVSLNRGDWGGRMIEEYLAGRGVTLRPVLEFDSFEAVIMTVQRGVGVSILHQGCTDHPLRAMIRRIPLGETPLTRRLGLLYRPTGQRLVVLEALVRELQLMTTEQPQIWLPLRQREASAEAAAG